MQGTPVWSLVRDDPVCRGATKPVTTTTESVFQSPCQCQSESRSAVSDSLEPHGLYSPWNSLGQNTGLGSHSLLQAIFSTQGSNPGLPHCRWILYQLSHNGKPKNTGMGSLSLLRSPWAATKAPALKLLKWGHIEPVLHNKKTHCIEEPTHDNQE